MDVSTASSSSAGAYQHMRRAHHRRHSESRQDASGSAGPQATGSTRPQGSGNGPGSGNDLSTVLDQLLKSGGGVDDVKAQLQKNMESFQSSDRFKSLPPEVQQKIEQRDSSDNLDKLAQKIVNRYQQTGTTKPPEHPQGDRAQWMAKLEEQGGSQQASVYAKFGVGGFAPQTAAPAEEAEIPADSDAIAGA